MNYNNHQYYTAPNYNIGAQNNVPYPPQNNVPYPAHNNVQYTPQNNVQYTPHNNVPYPAHNPYLAPQNPPQVVLAAPHPSNPPIYCPPQIVAPKPNPYIRSKHWVFLGIFGAGAATFIVLGILNLMFGLLQAFDNVYMAVMHMFSFSNLSYLLDSYASYSTHTFTSIMGIKPINIACGDPGSLIYKVLGNFRPISLLSSVAFSILYFGVAFCFYIAGLIVGFFL